MSYTQTAASMGIWVPPIDIIRQKTQKGPVQIFRPPTVAKPAPMKQAAIEVIKKMSEERVSQPAPVTSSKKWLIIGGGAVLGLGVLYLITRKKK